MKHFLSLLLALLLVLSCLAGCGGNKASDTPEPTETDTAATPDTETETDAAAFAAEAFDAAYASHEPDAVVMTVSGEPVTWGAYFSWIHSVLLQLSNYYGISDLSEEITEGYTYADYLKEYAEGMCTQYAMLSVKAKELGITLDAEEQALIEEMIQADADQYYDGDQEAMFDYLRSIYISEDYYRYMNEASVLYFDLFAHYMGEDGEKVSDEDVAAYLADNEIMHAKHILFKTTDDSNQPLDDDAIAQKRADAEAALKKLRAANAEELDGLFTSLLEEYGEDPGMLSMPDGYYFTSGMMVEPFETAAAALEVGQVSEITESDYGYHILYRPAESPEDVYSLNDDGSPYTLRAFVADELFNNITAEWLTEPEVVYAEEFADLDLVALFATA